MAKHITVRAAQPNTGDQEVGSIYLTITGCFPYSRSDEDLIEAREGFKEDAERVFIALQSLPRGTFDQLLVLMLQDTASSLIVATDPALSDAEYHQRKAAPETFKALKLWLPEIEGTFEGRSDTYDEMVDLAREAVRKARGESEAQDG